MFRLLDKNNFYDDFDKNPQEGRCWAIFFG